jgi:hypothetical protein
MIEVKWRKEEWWPVFRIIDKGSSVPYDGVIEVPESLPDRLEKARKHLREVHNEIVELINKQNLKNKQEKV